MKFCTDKKNFLDDVFVFIENDLMVLSSSELSKLPTKETVKKILESNEDLDFFTDIEFNYSAIMLSSETELKQKFTFIPLRQFFYETKTLTFKAARAHGLLKLRQTNKFCSVCGSPLVDDNNFTAKKCTKCGTLFFPRIEPAIIVLVHKENEILLVKNKNHRNKFWSCVAGFVEMGETLEAAVAREVKEETNIEIKNIEYKGSQSWPFPDQLMFAFYAEYKSGQIKIQEEELDDAKWFSLDNLPTLPNPGSVAWNLINNKF